ncbi:MAG: hypothetical protein BWY74_02855 [Firmicutes bacterium ADurb.Bin419]|nr:MAG: hypothetical protein BWY74_02855 [Firmicutes bacterium ADurb.Bin419]
MSINKLNAEGYFDLTAYEALKKIEVKAKKQTFRPIVFICSPFAGDVDRNIQKAQGYSRFAVNKNSIPFAPHLLFPQFLDDEDKEQRELGLFFGMVFMAKCHELWVFGRNITQGMSVEIEKAKERRLKIRYFNEQCEEVEPI